MMSTIQTCKFSPYIFPLHFPHVYSKYKKCNKYFYCIYIFCRTNNCLLNQQWGNVNDVLHKMQRYPLDIQGDGFCFIYSLMESLSHDHKITLEFNQVCQLILDHLCNENEKYLNFYTKRAAHLFVTTSDLMMEEVICFFDFGNLM